jgi:methyltransferase
LLIRAVICGLMTTARLLELKQSRANVKAYPAVNEGPLSKQTFPLIVAVHSVVIGGTLLRGERRPRRLWLLALLAVQPLRWWMLTTLGDRWNARGAVPAAMPVATDGPYAFVRHPNYSIIVVELASLPLAFGLRRLALVAGLANAALLTIRVREEEALLFQLPGYREHFEDRARFVPFVF